MNIVNIAHSAAALLAMVIFLYVLRQGPGGAIVSYFLANLLAAAGAIYFILKIVPWPWSIDFGLLGRLAADGIKLHFGVVGIFVFLKIDQLMLNYYRQASSVGFYTVAVSLADLLLLIPGATQIVFYSKITSLLSDKERIAEKVLRVYRHSLFLFFGFSLLLVLCAKYLIILFYGRTFLPALAPFFILLPGVFFLYLSNILINGLVAMQRFLEISLIAIIGAVINVVLNMVLIPRYDAAGASWSSTITYVLVGSCVIVLFLRVSGYSMRRFSQHLVFTAVDIAVYKEFFKRLVLRRK